MLIYAIVREYNYIVYCSQLRNLSKSDANNNDLSSLTISREPYESQMKEFDPYYDDTDIRSIDNRESILVKIFGRPQIYCWQIS